MTVPIVPIYAWHAYGNGQAAMIYIHIITVFIYIFFYFYVSMVLRFVDHAEDICRRASNRCHLCRVAHNCCAGRRLSFAATQCQFFFFLWIRSAINAYCTIRWRFFFSPILLFINDDEDCKFLWKDLLYWVSCCPNTEQRPAVIIIIMLCAYLAKSKLSTARNSIPMTGPVCGARA